MTHLERMQAIAEVYDQFNIDTKATFYVLDHVKIKINTEAELNRIAAINNNVPLYQVDIENNRKFLWHTIIHKKLEFVFETVLDL